MTAFEFPAHRRPDISTHLTRTAAKLPLPRWNLIYAKKLKVISPEICENDH
jgi:hypothetical protein